MKGMNGAGHARGIGIGAGRTAPAPATGAEPPANTGDRAGVEPSAPEPTAVSFADWLSGALRREGMTLEAAARSLSVSAKTVSRWVGGATEPRLRDLSRIREVFGDMPFP
jgi:hypothetical protein